MFLEFGLLNSTNWEYRTLKISAFELTGSRIKRFRKPERNDVGKALRWIKSQSSDNIPVSGSCSQVKFCSCRVLIQV
jgi:hypothetical protein